MADDDNSSLSLSSSSSSSLRYPHSTSILDFTEVAQLREAKKIIIYPMPETILFDTSAISDNYASSASSASSAFSTFSASSASSDSVSISTFSDEEELSYDTESPPKNKSINIAKAATSSNANSAVQYKIKSLAGNQANIARRRTHGDSKYSISIDKKHYNTLLDNHGSGITKETIDTSGHENSPLSFEERESNRVNYVGGKNGADDRRGFQEGVSNNITRLIRSPGTKRSTLRLEELARRPQSKDTDSQQSDQRSASSRGSGRY